MHSIESLSHSCTPKNPLVRSKSKLNCQTTSCVCCAFFFPYTKKFLSAKKVIMKIRDKKKRIFITLLPSFSKNTPEKRSAKRIFIDRFFIYSVFGFSLVSDKKFQMGDL